MLPTFLGTGAADWKEPKPDGEYRRNTATLIDGELLIDGNETISDSLPKIEGVPLMLFTHSHSDHFSAEFLRRVHPGRAFAERSWAKDAGAEPLDVGIPVEYAGYTVTPMPANHSTHRADETPLAFLIAKNGKRLLYATDGAWLTNRAYHILKDAAPIDAAVFDATVGDDFPHDWRVFEHNTLPMARDIVSSLSLFGVLKPRAPVFLTHFARTLHPSQAELEAREAKTGSGLIICRDGMSREI